MRICVLLFVLTCTTVLAQTRPQLSWQGYITGGATLFIQKDRVDVQGRNTGAVDRPKYHFNDPLPATTQDVTLRVRRGRGRAEIAEQPASGNEYTAIVDLQPPGDRPEFYAVEFYWKTK